MVVTITSPCLGKAVGETYTGELEPWLLVQGYARNAATLPDKDTVPPAVGETAYAGSFAVDPENDNPTDYTGSIGGDGLNTLTAGGQAPAVLAVDDPTDPANREAPWFPANDEGNWSIANDADNLTGAKFPNPDYDFDQGGVDTEQPSNLTLSPASGEIEGGLVVTIKGDNLKGVTGVTFGGTAGTALVTTNAARGSIKVTTPAHAVGVVDVIVTDDVGSTTMTGAFEYIDTP